MPFHLRNIEKTCEDETCQKVATVRLYDSYNSPWGRFCRKHGEKRLNEKNAATDERT